MKPPGKSNASCEAGLLRCSDLWATAILHAALIGALVLWYPRAFGAWPLFNSDSSLHLVEAMLVLNTHWVALGSLIWVGDIGAYWLIRARRGLKHALVFGAIMTLVWTMMLLAGLAREFMTVKEDVVYWRERPCI